MAFIAFLPDVATVVIPVVETGTHLDRIYRHSVANALRICPVQSESSRSDGYKIPDRTGVYTEINFHVFEVNSVKKVA